VGIAAILLLTWINAQGVRIGAVIQNIFTIAKTGALLGLIAVGFFLGRDPAAVEANFSRFWNPTDFSFAAIQLVGVAMVGSLFSSDAWNNVTFTAGETRNPQRNLPLSLALGVGIVSLLYLACNFVYLSALPLAAIQSAPQDRVGTAVIERILGGQAAGVMAAAIMVSTFGCLNGLILAGARVYYAMALDGLFFKAVSRLDPRKGTPTVSLGVQCVWASLLTLSGQYNELLDYVIFAVLLFYMLTIVGLFVLRRTQPHLPRPYRAFGYPALPAFYLLMAGVIEVLLLLYKPKFTWPGLALVLSGIPVYFLWKRNLSKDQKREVPA
jgi:APA family basic amino acid/polyamine antiporter